MLGWILDIFDKKSARHARRLEDKAWVDLAKKLDKGERAAVIDDAFLLQVEASEEELYGTTSKLTNKIREAVEKSREEVESREEDAEE